MGKQIEGDTFYNIMMIEEPSSQRRSTRRDNVMRMMIILLIIDLITTRGVSFDGAARIKGKSTDKFRLNENCRGVPRTLSSPPHQSCVTKWFRIDSYNMWRKELTSSPYHHHHRLPLVIIMKQFFPRISYQHREKGSLFLLLNLTGQGNVMKWLSPPINPPVRYNPQSILFTLYSSSPAEKQHQEEEYKIDKKYKYFICSGWMDGIHWPLFGSSSSLVCRVSNIYFGQ